MTDEDQADTADDFEIGGDDFVATDQDLDAIADNDDTDDLHTSTSSLREPEEEDIDDPGDGDDSDDLYADLGLSNADRSDLDYEDEDEPTEIRQLTPDEFEVDEYRREYDLRAKSFGERVQDMHRGPTHGERRAAAVWAQFHEAVREQDLAEITPEGQAEREAAAVKRAAEYFEAEDADPGPGFISGEGSEHDHADAARRRRAAMSNWDSFCNDFDD